MLLRPSHVHLPATVHSSYLRFLEASFEKQARYVEAPACSDFSSEALVPSLQLGLIECSQGRLACSSIGTGPEGSGHGNGDDDGRALTPNQVTALRTCQPQSCIRLSCSRYPSWVGRTLNVEYVSLGLSPTML